MGSALVQPKDASLVQVPPQNGFQGQIMVCVENQWLLFLFEIVVRIFLVVPCDESIGTDLDKTVIELVDIEVLWCVSSELCLCAHAGKQLTGSFLNTFSLQPCDLVVSYSTEPAGFTRTVRARLGLKLGYDSKAMIFKVKLTWDLIVTAVETPVLK